MEEYPENQEWKDEDFEYSNIEVIGVVDWVAGIEAISCCIDIQEIGS